MSLNQVVQDRLQSSSAAQLLGGTPGGFSNGFSNGFSLSSPGRIYPIKLPENYELPAIVYTIRPESDGCMSGSTGYIKASVTLDVVHKEHDDCYEIVEAAKSSLHFWRDAPQVMLMKWEQDQPIYSDDWFRVQSEYILHYKEV
jgi:hypothetical protein